jgi:tRNA threonylcarbamoyladenosine biosynthesis protein TsaE
VSDSQAIRVGSSSETETLRFGEALAEFLRPGSVVAIEGELGAGKTCFVRGLVRGLGGSDSAISPTFTYENRYRLGTAGAEFLHVDLYRIEGEPDPELLSSLLEARDAGAIVAVEWAASWLDRLRPCLHLQIEADAARRELRLESIPHGWKHFDALSARWRAIGGPL